MIQLDANKMPIWPDGKVPEHPRDVHGNPILPQPTWVPPPPEFPSLEAGPPGSNLAHLLDSLQRQIDELKRRVDSFQAT
jgi:hypothetical protein